MYPEFIAIYVMLAIVIIMLGAALFVLLMLMKNSSGRGNSYSMPQQNTDLYCGQQYQQPYQTSYQPQYQQAGGVVFCKRCATQFDASQPYCPQCGTGR